MTKPQVIFRGFRINDLVYSVNKEAERSRIKSEKISFLVSDIKIKVDSDLTNILVVAEVKINSKAVLDNEENEQVDYRKVNFDYFGNFSVKGADNKKELAEIMKNGGLHIALAHVREAVKNITSVDDRKPIFISDRPFPIVMNKDERKS